MRRFGTAVAVVAVLTAGGARAADQLIGDASLDSQMLGSAYDVLPAAPHAPWSSEAAVLGAQDGGQSYEVVVDGVEVGAFSTSIAPTYNPTLRPLGETPTKGATKIPSVHGLAKPAAWSLLILGFAAIGLTLRGGRRRIEVPAA
jgi:hypothetical protein